MSSRDNKKLDGKGCRNSFSTNFVKSDWVNWLETVSKFFSCYAVSSIRNIDTNYTRPYVSVSVNGKDVTGLLDTGSAVTILGNNFHKVILPSFTQWNISQPLTFVAAGGQKLSSKGFVSLPFTFENQTHNLNVHIVPDIKNSLILGMDFWHKFGLFPSHLNSILFLNPSDAQLAALKSDHSEHVQAYDHLSKEQRITADNIITQFRGISYEERGLGRTALISHAIDTGDTVPIRQRYYRMSPEKQRVLVEQLDEMLADDVVEPAESPWSSPVLLIPKKNGELRFCLDSRKLNAVTKKDSYKLPYISEIIDNLRDAKYLTSLDLSKSFWQILINEKDRCKTAFYIPTRGTYQFKSMPFGLTNAPATQQRLVDLLFYGPEFENKVFVYVDDIIIVSSTFEQHISLLLLVLNKLKLANLTINLKKSQFFREKLKYLGYVVDSKGLHADPEKVDAIKNYPIPTNKKEVRRFLGAASWYRRFIPNFSSLASPLNKLTSQSKKAPPFYWSQEADIAYTKLKDSLVSASVLSCPDYSQPFQIHTDASDYGIGAVLTQDIEGEERVIAYMSKSLSNQERNYSATEREALAVLIAVEHWRCYVENGQKFIVYTDHAALKWFLKLNNPTGRLARWGVRLSTYNFEIRHRRGTENVVPDFLSRSLPVSAIDDNLDNNSTPLTSDTWYLNIFNGCVNTPSSFLEFQVSNNKLFRYKKSLNPLTREFEWKEVVPLEHRTDLIIQNHAEPISGHLGIFKTFKRLALRYYWPGMYADVVKAINSCDTCIAHKHQNHAIIGHMGRPKTCYRPFQMLSIDLVGPLPPTRKQNCYIFVVTCCFSKYCLLFPIKRATAEIVTKILEENVFLVHGIPSTVILDNGKQFISATLRSVIAKYKIPNLHYTPKYSPHINTVERYNKTIMTAVSTFIDNDQRVWDLLIPKIQFAINSSVNEVTGFTPSFLVYGRELVSCGSHYKDCKLDGDIIFEPRDSYAENLGYLATIFNKVQTALHQAHSRNCQSYNLRRKPGEYNIGDIVWKRTFYQSDKDKYFNKKLAPKFIKCKVVGKKSSLVYELAEMSGKAIGEWHIKDLKRINYKG